MSMLDRSKNLRLLCRRLFVLPGRPFQSTSGYCLGNHVPISGVEHEPAIVAPNHLGKQPVKRR